MKFVATGNVQSLGFTKDEKFVALQIETEVGAPITIEFPIEHLPELSLTAVQMASLSAQRTGSDFDPPLLPVAKWSAGSTPTTGDIGLKFHYPKAGAHGFRIDRAAALALHSGLGQALNEAGKGN